jgi:hypothetical protein
VLFGCPPFKKPAQRDDHADELQVSFPPSQFRPISDECKALIRFLLASPYTETEKMTPQLVLKHPWFVQTTPEDPTGFIDPAVAQSAVARRAEATAKEPTSFTDHVEF